MCPVWLTPQQLKGKRTRKKNVNHSLRRPFTQEINTFRQILLGQKASYEEGLQLTPLNISAAQCSCCFGPSEGEVKSSPSKPYFSIAMDENFQHCHQCHASKHLPQEDQYPSSFIKPSKLKKEVVACKQTDAKANKIKGHNLTLFHLKLQPSLILMPFNFRPCVLTLTLLAKMFAIVHHVTDAMIQVYLQLPAVTMYPFSLPRSIRVVKSKFHSIYILSNKENKTYTNIFLPNLGCIIQSPFSNNFKNCTLTSL